MTYQVTIKTPNKTTYHLVESESIREAVRWSTTSDNACLIKMQNHKNILTTTNEINQSSTRKLQVLILS